MKSNFLNLNLQDLGKGLIVAVIAAVLTFAYEALQAGTLFAPGTFKTVGMVALGAALSYLIKNLFTNSTGQILKSEK
jgi:VIT1/CCC1 family predicted Fe2+/Mn2+ transporter